MIPLATHGAAASYRSSSWTPSRLSPNVWLDAATTTTFALVSSNYITEWRDKSGNNRHFYQTDSALMPRLTTYSERPNGAYFDGIDDRMTGSHGLGANPSEFAIFFAVYLYDVTSGSCRSKILVGNFNSYFEIGAYIGMPQYYNSTAWGFRSAFRDRYAGLGDATTGYHVYGLIKAGTNYFVSANGILSNAINFTDNLNFTDNVLIGRGSENYFFELELFELVICPFSLSSDDRQKLEGYLAHKWGIAGKLPSSHPYKNSPP